MNAQNARNVQNTRNGVPADAQFRQLHQHQIHLDNPSAYAMNHPTMGHHQHSLSQPSGLFAQMNAPQQHMMPTRYMSSHVHPTNASQMDPNENRPRTEPAPKPFACSTCSKGFARRSDLARHERIHSGIRPHACDYPGCGKEFIQRSALTVHTRVHTGEKPHMCEKCGKPFSDSSSLARHRRIHSGKRPYKCPYANCQKTFTRRTTLTRHQNHHTGTVEQAQAETNAKLSMTQAQSQSQSANSNYSENPSRNSTASPLQTISISPNQTMHSMQAIAHQNNDFQFMSHQQPGMPMHMRHEYQTHPTRLNQPMTTGPVAAFAGMSQPRMNMTSHPGGVYAPPQTLEPQTSGAGSGNASPHMGAMAWGSPNNGLTGQTSMDAFYHDQMAFGHHVGPTYAGAGTYYQNDVSRRPQSTEPVDYGLRSRSHVNHHLAAGQIPMSDPSWMQLRPNYAVGH